MSDKIHTSFGKLVHKFAKELELGPFQMMLVVMNLLLNLFAFMKMGEEDVENVFKAAVKQYKDHKDAQDVE